MASTEHHKALPDDVLDFLEVPDPDDVEGRRAEDLRASSEEELAVTPIPDAPRPAFVDPALREFDDDRRLPPASWFEDEEPEAPYLTADEDDEAESVDELLAAQHYLFDNETEPD
jgi:hypothetical protein